MLSPINILLATVAVLLHVNVQAQIVVDRSIKWDAAAKSYTSPPKSIVKMPTFPMATVCSKDGYLPHYTESIRLPRYGAVTVSLMNEVYEPVSATDIKSDNVPPSVQVTATTAIMQKVPYAIISFVPMRKNPLTGRIEKLVKCAIKIDVAADRENSMRKSLKIFTANSVLAIGNWYKVGVTATAVYRLDYNYLKNTCGFDLVNTPFSSIGVFGNGGGMVPDLNAVARYDDLQENPSYIVDANGNNRVDQGDYILFYGQGPDQWTYSPGATPAFQFTKNLYSDTNYYFITADQGTGKRIQAITSATSPTQTISQFDDYAAHEVDKYSLLGSGKMWFGDRMTTGLTPSTTIPFSFPNIITGSPVQYYSYVAANSPNSSTFNVLLNNSQQVITQNTNAVGLRDYMDAYEPSVVQGSFSVSSGSFNLVYNFVNGDASGNSAGYIYQVVLNAKRALTFTGGAMFFRSISSVGPAAVTQFTVGGANSNTHIWDVTAINAVAEISGTLSGSTLSYTVPTPALREFAAVDVTNSFSNPIPVGTVANQNLHAVGQPKMLIITPDDLSGPANDLAAFHSQVDGISVKVASLPQIYNEFGSGRRDISAIRDFVRMVYDKAGSDSSLLPKYLLLMGDGSFDPKDRIPNNNNQMPTYESYGSQNVVYEGGSYTTDDFFGCLDSTEGGDMGTTQQLDIAVGRLPAANASEAQGMVDKIKLYKSASSLASWRNVSTFVSDEPWDDRNGPGNSGNEFESDADGVAESVRLNYPANNVTKIYLDAYQLQSTPGGGRYPDVNTAILNQINTGTLLMSYAGHGGTNSWANARVFELSDIQQLQNHEKLPIFVTATCDFSWFDNPGVKSAGEYLITNALGGAAAMLTTVRPVYEAQNTILQQAFYPAFYSLYHGRLPTIGEAAMVTKNTPSVLGTGINNREFVLLGDPAMIPDYPRYNVVTTKVDNVPISLPHDTLKALKYVTISGEVRDGSGNKMTGFNGTCYPLIFDKLGQYHTLANYPGYEMFPYNAYKNSLFKGQCSVTNGAFSFSFIVPKDINYAVGNGRISYYADNGTIDATGYWNGVTIGGASDTNLLSKTGPVIKLFMNDDKFVYGGITDANPKLYAELSDPYGINTTGNGLGHDLTCILDANTKNPIVLNTYYQSALNNFTKGTVTYPFTNLSEGAHTLQLKAWDILDNSSTDNTEFIVASSARLALQHVYNYPNPFTTNTEFMFEHNRPGEELTVMVQIFSISGRLVKTIRESVLTTGYRVDNIRWDGLDDYGDKIGKGVYVYKIHVKDAEGNTANQFQKLVLLR